MTYKKESPAPTINEQLVVIQNDVTTTTSLIISNLFGKNHKDVIRAIENLELPTDFNRRNFAPVKYKDAKGQMRKSYNITRDGFMFIAMGFTGAKANEFKITLINAFNGMEAELTKRMYGESHSLTEVRKNVPNQRHSDLWQGHIHLYHLAQFRRFLGYTSIDKKEKQRYKAFFYMLDGQYWAVEEYVVLKIRSKTAYNQRQKSKAHHTYLVERALELQTLKSLGKKGGANA